MRPANAYLWAIVALTGIGVGALVLLDVFRSDVDRGLVAQILSIVLPTLAALLALLRGVANGQEIREVREVAQKTAAKQEAIDEAVRHGAPPDSRR